MGLLRFLIERFNNKRPFYYLWEERAFERRLERRFEQQHESYSGQSTCRIRWD